MKIPVWKLLRWGLPWRILLLALLLSGTSASAQGAPARLVPAAAKGHDPQETFQKGNAEYKAKRFPQALDAYLDSLAEVEDSKHPEVLYNIAATYRALHRPKEAFYYERRYQSLTLTLTQAPAPEPAPVKPLPPPLATPEGPGPVTGILPPKPAKHAAQASGTPRSNQAPQAKATRTWLGASSHGSWGTSLKYSIYVVAALLLILAGFVFAEGEAWGVLVAIVSIGLAFLGRLL